MPRHEAERLIIDPSPPEPVTEAEVRAWMRDQTVFISSVMAGMSDERDAAAAAVDALGGRSILFERLGGRDDDAESAYLAGVRSADIYVAILGERYGRPEPSGYSPTHAEYIEAVRAGLRISVWVTATGDLDGRQRDFLEEVRTFHTTGSYLTASDLGGRLENRFRELAAAAGSPWCKVGPVLFRARRCIDHGEKISIEAAVRNDEVVASLEALRPGSFGGPGPVAVTGAGRTSTARIDSVVVEATAGRARLVRIEATKDRRAQASNLVDASYDGRSPDDMTELAVRIGVFGEPNPLGTMAFLAEMPNPLAGLEGAGLDEDALPGAAEVLLIEALVGTGRADRLTSVRVGPRRAGTRRMRIEWLGRRRYTNVEPERRAVEGQVPA